MKTVRRLLYRDVVWSVVFVSLAFLSLFFFIDFVDELDKIGRNGYTLGHALVSSFLEMPGHLYELFPICVLIGTIYSMARLAQSSEFTILRTGGLGPGRALGLLALLGLLFALFTWAVGDWVSPWSERAALLQKSKFRGGIDFGRGGAWLKERRNGAAGERSVSVNVRRIDPDGQLQGIRIYEFDLDGRLRRRVEAASGRVGDGGSWELREAESADWPTPQQAREGNAVHIDRLTALHWASNLSADVVAAALLPTNTMSTIDLWRYASHLSSNEQAAQRHRIQFWKKALYPLACLVMMALALPFAYLHARAGGISLKVFGGIMLGISFVLLNNLSGHLGMLGDWIPWVAAATPGIFYLALSLAAFAWLVRYR